MKALYNKPELEICRFDGEAILIEESAELTWEEEEELRKQLEADQEALTGYYTINYATINKE